MYEIADNKKEQIRNKVITGAQKYKNYLVGKEFLVICEDFTECIVRFYANDFIHLTGLLSNLSDDDFFNNCCNSALSTGNIETLQKYNWRTLKNKFNRIENIDQIMYGNFLNSKFITNLHTNTATFPVAISNFDIDACIGFNTSYNKARTLRKQSNSTTYDSCKNIIAVFAKQPNVEQYNEKIFLPDKNILADKNDILSKLSDDIEIF